MTDNVTADELRQFTERAEQIAAEKAALQAKADAMEAALRGMIHAVCGETGFAACVRLCSGMAYPWPALDLAEDKARIALAQHGKDQTK